jgi:small-conductance mechanosensitive channel
MAYFLISSVLSRSRRYGFCGQPGWLFAVLLTVAAVATGCGRGDLPTDAVPAAVSDSVAAHDSVAIDTSIVAQIVPPAAVAAAQSVVVPAVQPAASRDTAATVSARLDSLLRQVAKLETSVRALQRQPSSSTSRRTPDTTSQSLRPREQLRETAQDVSNFGLRAFWAVVVITVAFFLIKFLVWILETSAERSAKRRLFFKKLIPVSRILVWLLVVYYVVAGIFEVDRDGLVAAGAALGVAIGFAAQDVLKNIFGGILIIIDQPFQVGDRVRVGGTYGEVVSIGLRSTRIVTPDDNLVSVPNTQVVDGQVANANAGALDCQVVTTLYLPGWVDVGRAKEIAYDAAANSKFVFLKKPIVVLVQDEFKETFLTKIIVKAYVLDARYEAAFASDVTETAKSQYLRENMLMEFYPGSARETESDDVEVSE